MVLNEVKKVILASVGSNLSMETLNKDYPLVGNILDSMAVTSLILALEEYFNFVFDEEDLSAETFRTVGSLAELVEKKICG